MSSDARQKLVSFLERKAFEPVLRADAHRFHGAQREWLEHVQRATRAEIERFRNYGSAQEVVVNFRRDLTSEKAKQVHRELRALGLPTIEDVEQEFMELARSLKAA